MSDTGDSNGTQDSGTYDPNQRISVLGSLSMPSQWSVAGDDADAADATGDLADPPPSIFGDAFNPKPWTPADNSLNFFVDPETMKTIDFSGGDTTGTGPSGDDTSQSGIVADDLDPSVLTASDLAGLAQTPPLPAPDDQGGASGKAPPAQKSPLTAWPVPGHTQLNPRKPQVGQGDGSFGAFRDHGGHAHTGIDITAPVGTPVVAAGEGTIASTQPGKFYGNQVIIQHAGGFGTQYGHMSRVDVKPGATVHAGDQIGLSGRSGNVPTGADAHVHFEVRYGSLKPHVSGGQVVDPMKYLPATP